MTTEQEICAQCLEKFDAKKDEDLYETENWGIVFICKNCIGPMAKRDLKHKAKN